jgi:hypothetical protein
MLNGIRVAPARAPTSIAEATDPACADIGGELTSKATVRLPTAAAADTERWFDLQEPIACSVPE